MARLTKNNHFRGEGQAGFTLIEILIVVILLGILATIIIPQVSVSSDDAKLNTLKTNLANMRSSLELYYYQHGNAFPGAKTYDGGADVTSDSDAEDAFVEQMTKYSNASGVVSDSGTSDYPYGPYMRHGIPINPYNNLNTVVCDHDDDNITHKDSSGSTAGWKFYPQTGILVSGDGGAHNDL